MQLSTPGRTRKPAVSCQRVGDGSIVTVFNKTPAPTTATSVVCPHFMELKWAYGCPYDCAWCYLKGTLRFQPKGTTPVFKDRSKVALHTTRFLEEAQTPEILNTGEIADSLMGEGLQEPFSRFIVPLFEAQSTHKVLFLTKSDKIGHLLSIEPHNQVIMSFSLNADAVARRWEKGAPSVDRRIEAGRKLKAAGYEVRVRIDPIVPVANWEQHYGDLVRQLFASYVPERITLGSLRGLQTTVNGSSDKSWVAYLEEKSNWGKKVRFDTRYAAFRRTIDVLRSEYGYHSVALCKETVGMWDALGLDHKNMRCNCIW